MGVTIKHWLQSASTELKLSQIESARLDSILLLEAVLGKTREWILSHDEEMLTDDNSDKLSKMIARRKNREPLAYIIGSKEFYGHSFCVNSSVLIPRPESESIIELLKKVMAVNDVNTVLDIGTGSGCLAVTAKLLFPRTHVTAVDISEDALKVARKNAHMHKVQIQFRKQDLRGGLPAMPRTRPYVVLANLPYVPEGMITSPEITKEPGLALFSAYNGMGHYIEFWRQVHGLKNKPVHIITESLKNQHADMQELALEAGYVLETTDTLAQLFTIT